MLAMLAVALFGVVASELTPAMLSFDHDCTFTHHRDSGGNPYLNLSCPLVSANGGGEMAGIVSRLAQLEATVESQAALIAALSSAVYPSPPPPVPPSTPPFVCTGTCSPRPCF